VTTFDRILASLRGEAAVWPDGTGWHDALTIAERHGVAMLLAQSTPSVAPDAWARNTIERALHLARQLRTLIRALNASGIEVIPVKGPALALTAYGDAARRGVSGDLDLVVRPHDFQRALSCLLACGYVRDEGSFDPAYEQEQWQGEAHLLPPTLPAAMVELHTELIGSPKTAPLNLDEVFSRARTSTVFGVPMLVMAAEDQLLYLCLHGARHHWSRLLWVCDIDAIIRCDPSIDWHAVASRAASIDATRRVALGLHLAHTLLGTHLPTAASELTAARPRPRTSALITRRMADTSDGRRVPSFWLLLAAELSLRETLRQRLSYFRQQLIPTPRDRAWIRLPRRLEWLYVLLRPWRLLTRFGNAYEQRR
jgi:hypothetical protein